MACGITVAPMMPTDRVKASPSARCGTTAWNATAPQSRRRHRQLDEISEADDSDEGADQQLQRPEPGALQQQDRVGDDARRDHAGDERQVGTGAKARSRRRGIRRGRSPSPRPRRRSTSPTPRAGENASRHNSARLRPVTMPSLAESAWKSIAIRFASSDHPQEIVVVFAPASMLVAKLPGSM